MSATIERPTLPPPPPAEAPPVQPGPPAPARSRWPARLAAGALGFVVAFGYMDGLRPWMAGWGATPAERVATLPGDVVVAWPQLEATHAISIAAPPAAVWPWLVQIGTGRGGWYSYDWLDNGGHPSADRVIPALQGLRAGDNVPITPDGKMGFPVFMLDAPRTLGLGGTFAQATGEPTAGAATWVMHLRPEADGGTRLLVRMRMRYEPTFAMLAMHAALEPIHFVMERKMLVELKHRIEHPAAERIDMPATRHAAGQPGPGTPNP